jgi:predicted TIM-barrel enzyme
MLFALSAQSRGYRVLYFGPDLPLQQVERVIQRSGARAVIMSARTPVTKKQDAELAALTKKTDVPVMLGGLASDQAIPEFETAGGVRLGSLVSVGVQLLISRVDVHSGANSL